MLSALRNAVVLLAVADTIEQSANNHLKTPTAQIEDVVAQPWLRSRSSRAPGEEFRTFRMSAPCQPSQRRRGVALMLRPHRYALSAPAAAFGESPSRVRRPAVQAGERSAFGGELVVRRTGGGEGRSQRPSHVARPVLGSRHLTVAEVTRSLPPNPSRLSKP